MDATYRLCTSLERKNGCAGEEHDRKQQVNHDDWPAQVACDREQPDGRLSERAEEDGERKPRRPARQRRCTSDREPDEQRERDGHSADESIAELDERVRVLRR